MVAKTAVHLTNRQWDALIGRVYDAAANPGIWHDLLRDIGKPVYSHAAQLVSISSDPADTLDDVYVGFDQKSAIREFEDFVSRRQHVRVNYGISVPEMTTVYDYLHTSERAMKRDVCYQEHLIPLKVPYYVATPLISTGASMTAVGHFRRKQYGHFRKSEIRYLARFAPHIRRSLELSRRLSRKGMIAGVETLLSALACPAAVVDHRLDIVAINDDLLSIARERDGISVERHKLRLSDENSRSQLKRELAAGLHPDVMACLRGSGRITAKRKSGRKAYHLFVIPLHMKMALTNRRLWLLLVADPERPCKVDCGALQDAFGLTRAEAEVAGLLAHGYTITEIAGLRESAVETVKSQVKAALRKSDSNRQADLIAHIYRLQPSPLVS